MDPISSGYPIMLAPGASSPSSQGPLHCPGPGDAQTPSGGGRLPRLDESLLPEDSPYEILDGQRILTMANPEHAGPQAQLASVLRAAAASGCYALVDLTTRADTAPPPPGLDANGDLPPTVNELRSDACVLREGIDARTGDRFVEELSFEVVNEQSLSVLKKKAVRLTARGVRRVFGLLVKKGQVVEWSARQQEFVPVVGEIRDPCLRVPLPIRALLDAAVAEDTVVRALDAKGNPALLEIENRGLHRGKRVGLAEGQQQALLTLLAARGFAVTPDVRSRIEGCQDPAALTTWITRAATATALEDVFPS